MNIVRRAYTRDHATTEQSNDHRAIDLERL